MAADHPLDRAIALVAARADDPRCLSGATSEDYWNAVGPFGGVTAATLLNAVLLQPDRLGVPLSLTVRFDCCAVAAPPSTGRSTWCRGPPTR
ncbi:MAG: hypothetical protein NTV19_16455 [Burkholderiales bacterium]|nr:hypothetical protein [Burkholderiales bacterium]